MNTSTKEFPYLAQRVNEIVLEDLFDGAIDSFPSSRVPLVILSSGNDYQKDFSDLFAQPVFRCKSLHDFLRQGFNRSAFVLVAPVGRAECSSFDLLEILSSRCREPFEVIWLDSGENSKLITLVMEASDRVQEKVTIESIAENSTRKIVNESERSRANSQGGAEIAQSRQYRIAKKLLSKRISEEITKRPESFLKKEISKIRKG